MNSKWINNYDYVDWNELSNLYKIAPLGDKKLKDNNKIILYVNPRKEQFYPKLGFLKR